MCTKGRDVSTHTLSGLSTAEAWVGSGAARSLDVRKRGTKQTLYIRCTSTLHSEAGGQHQPRTARYPTHTYSHAQWQQVGAGG